MSSYTKENYFLKNIKLQNKFHIFIANFDYTSSRKKEMRQSLRRERGRIRIQDLMNFPAREKQTITRLGIQGSRGNSDITKRNKFFI